MELKVYTIQTQCLVVGGGPAGYGAAMAAQRGCCSVVLAERHGFLGGMGTAAGLSCYLNHRYESIDLSSSVYREFVHSQDALGLHYYDPISQADIFEPESCKRSMEQLFIEAGGSLIYHSLLLSVEQDDAGDWLVTFASKGAYVKVSCRYLIDTTGDGDTCSMAGAEMTHGRLRDGLTQPMSMVVQLGGFRPKDWLSLGFPLVEGKYVLKGDCYGDEIKQAREAGKWSIPREEVALFWSMPGDPTRVTINGTRIFGLSACDPFEMSQAEIEGRRQAGELLQFFRRNVPGFSQAYLLQTGPQVGVRESRRIVGRETLGESHVRTRVIKPTSVALCAYPIDIHSPDDTGTQFEKVSSGHVYGIPWNCLVPVGKDNLLAAGRCISATHEAAGSFRVMPTCMSIGEAAGTGVALAARENCSLSEIEGEAVRLELANSLHRMGESSIHELFHPECKVV